VVIPTGAVQRGPNGAFVYVVKPDETVTVRPVTVQKQDELQTVVKRGLTPPERLVTTGFARLTEGTKVAVAAPGGTPAAPPANSRPRNRQRPASVGQGERRRKTGTPNRTQ